MLPAEYATELTEEERAERHATAAVEDARRPSLKGMSSLKNRRGRDAALADDVSKAQQRERMRSSAKLNRRMS